MEVSKERMIELVKNAPDGATHLNAARQIYIAEPTLSGKVAACIDEKWCLVDWYDLQHNYVKLDYSVLNGMGEGNSAWVESKPNNLTDIKLENYRAVSTPEMIKLVEFMNKHEIGKVGDSCVDLAIQALTEKYVRAKVGEDKPVYTKEMQEAGELPPIGCECELVIHNESKVPQEYIRANGDCFEIVAHHKNLAVGVSHDPDGGGVDVTFTANDAWWKPIKTDQEKLIDELVKEMGFGANKDGIDVAKNLLSKFNITRKGDSND